MTKREVVAVRVEIREVALADVAGEKGVGK